MSCAEILEHEAVEPGKEKPRPAQVKVACFKVLWNGRAYQ
jgi:hypothetical protein